MDGILILGWVAVPKKVLIKKVKNMHGMTGMKVMACIGTHNELVLKCLFSFARCEDLKMHESINGSHCSYKMCHLTVH